MKKIKWLSFITLLILISAYSFLLYEFTDTILNEKNLLINLYLEFIDRDIKVPNNENILYLYPLFYLVYLTPLFFLTSYFLLSFKLFLMFIQGRIFEKKVFYILKAILFVFVLENILTPIIQIYYVDSINKIFKYSYEIREFYIYDRIIGLLIICFIMILSWIFFEALKLKKDSDEIELHKQSLVQKHKLSMLGDMLGFISHEWKEPLSRISSYLINIQINNRNTSINEKIDSCQNEIQFMNNVLNDFKTFYISSSNKKIFLISKEIEYILTLIRSDLIVNKIDVDFNSLEKHNECFVGQGNEFSQVLLILLTNSKEAFINRNIKNRKINISLVDSSVYYSDNAGGIDNKDIDKIFLTEFSTKKQNMGIGLHFAKLIVEEKLEAKITVNNIRNGLEFKINLKNEENNNV